MIAMSGKNGVQIIVFALTLLSGATIAASAATLEERLAPCLACHGTQGQSEKSEVPSLGAQPAFYLLVQLYMFREGMRVVEPMNETMKDTSDDELRSMSDFISKLPPPQPAADNDDVTRLEQARSLIHANRCNYCHSQNFVGGENIPRLAGQREDYLVKALRAYKHNTRRAYEPWMSNVLYTVTEEQLADLAYFLARVR
jgi:cytochrome c553